MFVTPSRTTRSRWQTLAWWLAAGTAAVGAFTAFVPLLPVNTWWVRVGDFPRVQLGLLYLLAILPLIPFARDGQPHTRWARIWCGALIAGIAIQVYWIAPYLPIAPVEVYQARTTESQRRIRALSANVLQANQNSRLLLDQIEREQPDLVALVEVNERWIRELEPLLDSFPHRILHPLENRYGIALYSRLALSEGRVRTLIKDHIPSIQAAVTLRNGHRVAVFVVHPNPPRPGESTRKRDAELVLVGREVRATSPSAIVLGDLNDVGWSRTTNLFQEVSGLLDPRKGRGLYPTYDANSWFWRYPIDHVFHSGDFRVAEMRTLPHIGSDHLPLLVELTHEPDAEASQSAPSLDSGDREDAQDAVQKVR